MKHFLLASALLFALPALAEECPHTDHYQDQIDIIKDQQKQLDDKLANPPVNAKWRLTQAQHDAEHKELDKRLKLLQSCQ